MFKISHALALTFVTVLGVTSRTAAQTPQTTQTPPAPHLVVVRLVERGGSAPYAFEPATVQVEHGDTLRFLEAVDVPHNIHFTKEPSGAKLGSAGTGPYLVSKGQKYDLVIDSRFTDGVYTFVCDPHEMLGMRGSLTVVTESAMKTAGK